MEDTPFPLYLSYILERVGFKIMHLYVYSTVFLVNHVGDRWTSWPLDLTGHAPTVVVLWGVNQSMEDLSLPLPFLPSLCHCPFQINES